MISFLRMHKMNNNNGDNDDQMLVGTCTRHKSAMIFVAQGNMTKIKVLIGKNN